MPLNLHLHLPLLLSLHLILSLILLLIRPLILLPLLPLPLLLLRRQSQLLALAPTRNKIRHPHHHPPLRTRCRTR